MSRATILALLLILPSARSQGESCLTEEGDPCVFPFTYSGVTYSQCSYADSSTPWCSTATTQTGGHISGQYGTCSESCPVQSTEDSVQGTEGVPARVCGAPIEGKNTICEGYGSHCGRKWAADTETAEDCMDLCRIRQDLPCYHWIWHRPEQLYAKQCWLVEKAEGAVKTEGTTITGDCEETPAPVGVCADLVKKRNIVCKDSNDASCGREVEANTETPEECRELCSKRRDPPCSHWVWHIPSYIHRPKQCMLIQDMEGIRTYAEGNTVVGTCVPPEGPVKLQPASAQMPSVWTHKGQGYDGSMCIDGDINTLCSSTEHTYPWLAIIFDTPVAVSRVEIVNRNHDLWGLRTKNLEVWVANSLPSTAEARFTTGQKLGSFLGPAGAGDIIEINGEKELVGKMVVIQTKPEKELSPDILRNYLNLQEVTVYGHYTEGST